MDKFQISDKPTGPWLELAVWNTAQAALDAGRASFDWPMVWVAKMQPLMAEDIMPSVEVLYGDIQEIATLRYGSSVADEIGEFLSPERGNGLQNIHTVINMTGIAEVMVAGMKKAYSKEMQVRKNDFIPKMPSLEGLLDE